MLKINILCGIILLVSLNAVSYGTGPIVTALSWGSVTVKDPDGKLQKYRDCILFPAGSKSWDWRITGTQHVPGIQVADLRTKIDNIQELIDVVDIIILSQGMENVLRVQKDTVPFLESIKKEYHVMQTEDAVKYYNELVAEGKKVGALIHSTC